ncbi:MAG: hypothetical protein GX621_11685 [Pirellulaceae bacterium]|nr:hypothetical protein [Pirellulaceae bacterium]
MRESPQHELLSAYLDGAVTDEERARVEQWLVDDPAARRTLDELRAVVASLAGLPKLEIGEDLSDRVLRAAERHILSEPTRLANQPSATPRAAPASMRSIARRLVTSRGLAWSGMAVAVAVVLTVFQFRSPELRHPIAKMAETPASGPASVPVIGPVGDSPALGSSAKRFSSVSDSAAEALAETGLDELEHEPVLTSKMPGEALVPLAKDDRAKAAAPAGSPPPPRAAVTRLTETRSVPIRGIQSSETTLDVETAADAAAETPVARAARNPAEVLVIDCRFSSAALKDDAFGRTLAAHGIEIVEKPEVEEPLARQLVENVVRASSDFREIRRGESESRVTTRPKGADGFGSAMQPAKPPTDAHSLGTAPGYVDTAADADVEIVLVEGSPGQIAATISALGRRGDATVSVPSRQQAWLDQTLEDGRSRFAAAAETAGPRPAANRGRKVAKGDASDRSDRRAGVADKESPRALGRSAASQQARGQQQALSQPGDAMQIAPPRATAQRLGRMALREAPPTAGQQAKVESDRHEDRIDQRLPDSVELMVEGEVQREAGKKQESATASGLAPASSYQVESREGRPRLQQVLFVLHRTPLAEPARAAASAEADAQAAPTREPVTPDDAPAPSSLPAKNRDSGE